MSSLHPCSCFVHYIWIGLTLVHKPLPTNPGWYYAVAVLILPFAAVNYIHPAWVVRLIALSGVFFGVPIILPFFAIRVAKIIHEDAPLVRRYGKARMVVGWRVVLIGVALLSAWLTWPSLLNDISGVITGDIPAVRVGVVADKNSTGFVPFIDQDIVLDHTHPNRLSDSFMAVYFPPRFFVIGKTYRILYLPSSRIIVDAELING